MTPSRIGRYEIQRRLGTGGMGSLYLARDPSLDRLVAIKLLRDDFHDDPELRERFTREARSVARLRHPNIIIVHDVGEHDGRPFMAMEYVAGETLTRVLRRKPAMPLTERLALVEDLCAGLAHAHGAGIVHRDIKPANVMIDGHGVLKILDFGIARLTNSGMTQDGMMLGSVNYMSPEQVVGRGVDHRTDIFATGAVLYEVVALEQAFPGGIDSGVLHRILNVGPAPLYTRVPDLDPELARIVERALQRDPAERYDNIDVMRRDLTRVRRRLLDAADDSIMMPPADRTAIVRPKTSPSGAVKPPDSDRPRRLDPHRFAELRRQQLEEHLRLAESAFAAGDHDAALHHAERAAAADPDSRDAYDLIDRARLEIDSKAVRQLLAEARERIAEGRLDEAGAFAERALAAVPDLAAAGPLRTEVLDVAGEVDALRDREQRIAASLERARTSLDRGGYETALRAVYEALALDPDRTEARELEQAAQAGLQAKREHEQARRIAHERLKLARTLALERRFEEAERVIALISPPSDTVRLAAGEALEAVRRLQRQAAQAEIVARARAHFGAREYEQAMAALDAIPDEDRTDEARGLRKAASDALEAQRELERKRAALGEALAAVGALIEAGDLARGLDRLEAAARIGVEDQRIGQMRQRIADLAVAAQERRRQEARDALAERTSEAARRLFAKGDHAAAVELLERDRSGHAVVAQALAALRAAIAEAEERARQEAERRRREEEERRRREAEAEAVRIREEQRLAEEKRQEEEARRRREEEERRRLEAEAEAVRIREEQRLAEEKHQEEEARRRREEEERRRLEAEAEAARIREERRLADEKRQQEEAQRRREEEERRRLETEAEAARIREERRLADEKRQQEEAQRRREEEEQRRREAEAEAARIREEQRLAEEKRQAEEARRRREEEERLRLEAQAEAARIREEQRHAEEKRRQEAARRHEQAENRKREQARRRDEAEQQQRRAALEEHLSHAHVLVARGELEAAREEADAALAIDGTHADALDLREAIDREMQQRAEEAARLLAPAVDREQQVFAEPAPPLARADLEAHEGRDAVEPQEERWRSGHEAGDARAAHEEATVIAPRSEAHAAPYQADVDATVVRAPATAPAPVPPPPRRFDARRIAAGAILAATLGAAAFLISGRDGPQDPARPETSPSSGAASPAPAPPPRESAPKPAAPAPDSRAEPPPAPVQPAPAEPKPSARDAQVERELRSHRGRARELLSAGDPLRALAALRSALELRPDDPASRAMLNELAADVRSALQRARQEAQGRSAEQLAPQTFAAAAALGADADEERRAGRLDRAVQLWLSARNMFSAAADQAGRAAAARQAERDRASATPPPAAAPAAPPPATTAPQPPASAAPAPRPAPPQENPVSRTEAERPAILRTLSAYEQAWASLDAAAIGRVHQLSASEMVTVRSSVDAARRIEVTVVVQNVGVSPDGRQARVAAEVRRTFIPKSAARPSNSTVNTVFTMEKRGDAWVIVALR